MRLRELIVWLQEVWENPKITIFLLTEMQSTFRFEIKLKKFGIKKF